MCLKTKKTDKMSDAPAPTNRNFRKGFEERTRAGTPEMGTHHFVDREARWNLSRRRSLSAEPTAWFPGEATQYRSSQGMNTETAYSDGQGREYSPKYSHVASHTRAYCLDTPLQHKDNSSEFLAPPALRTNPSWPTPFIESFFPSDRKAAIAQTEVFDCTLPETNFPTRQHSLFGEMDDQPPAFPDDTFSTDDQTIERLHPNLHWQAVNKNDGQESQSKPNAGGTTRLQDSSNFTSLSLEEVQSDQQKPISLNSSTNVTCGDEKINWSGTCSVTMQNSSKKKITSLTFGEHSSAIIDAALSEQNDDIIINPNSHDILLGRGNLANYHEGNRNFRAIVKKYKTAYLGAPTSRKIELANIVINEVADLDPPGRFLTQDSTTLLWRQVDKKRALGKVRQALRERPFVPRSKSFQNDSGTP